MRVCAADRRTRSVVRACRCSQAAENEPVAPLLTRSEQIKRAVLRSRAVRRYSYSFSAYRCSLQLQRGPSAVTVAAVATDCGCSASSRVRPAVHTEAKRVHTPAGTLTNTCIRACTPHGMQLALDEAIARASEDYKIQTAMRQQQRRARRRAWRTARSAACFVHRRAARARRRMGCDAMGCDAIRWAKGAVGRMGAGSLREKLDTNKDGHVSLSEKLNAIPVMSK